MLPLLQLTFVNAKFSCLPTLQWPQLAQSKLRVAELREWLKAKEVAYLPRDTKRTLQQIATAYLKAHVTSIDKAKVDGMTDEEVSDALELRGLHRRGNLETRRERLKSAAQETPAADGNGGNVPASAAGVAPQASTGDSALLKQLLGELAKVNSRMDALEARGPSKRSPAATASAAETKQEETAASQWRAAVDVDMTNEGTSMTPAKRSAEDIDGEFTVPTHLSANTARMVRWWDYEPFFPKDLNVGSAEFDAAAFGRTDTAGTRAPTRHSGWPSLEAFTAHFHHLLQAAAIHPSMMRMATMISSLVQGGRPWKHIQRWTVLKADQVRQHGVLTQAMVADNYHLCQVGDGVGLQFGTSRPQAPGQQSSKRRRTTARPRQLCAVHGWCSHTTDECHARKRGGDSARAKRGEKPPPTR